MQRLLADNAAFGMLGMARALNGLTGVIDPRDMIRVKGMARLHVADWMPAFINAVRVLFAVGAISLFWIVSAWPNGVAAITFCAVIVILLPPSGDAAYSAPILFLQGSALSAVLAALVVFGILPKATSFPTPLPGPGTRARAARISECSRLEADVFLCSRRQLPADALHHQRDDFRRVAVLEQLDRHPCRHRFWRRRHAALSLRCRRRSAPRGCSR